MFPSALIGIVVALVIVGIVLWALTQFPIDPTIAKLIRVLVIVIAAIWVCYALFGMVGGGVGHFGTPVRLIWFRTCPTATSPIRSCR